MNQFQWYRGIEQDVEAAKTGAYVVLHSDENVCRVMSYTTGGGGKLCLCGYPNRDKYRIIASSKDRTFHFNGHTYCSEPCYLYDTVSADDTEAVKKMYRQYVDNGTDTQLDLFMQSREKSRQAAKKIKINGDENPDLTGNYTLVVTFGNKSLGQIDIFYRMKEFGSVRRVVEFNKRKLYNDVWQLLVAHGNPPARDTAAIFVDNLLTDFCKELKSRGVEFDPSLFEA